MARAKKTAPAKPEACLWTEAEFVAHAEQLDLEPDWFGQAFPGTDGQMVKICGVVPQRPLSPVIATHPNKNRYTYSAEYVRQRIGDWNASQVIAANEQRKAKKRTTRSK
jgi:hypothetical protein